MEPSPRLSRKNQGRRGSTPARACTKRHTSAPALEVRLPWGRGRRAPVGPPERARAASVCTTRHARNVAPADRIRRTADGPNGEVRRALAAPLLRVRVSVQHGPRRGDVRAGPDPSPAAPRFYEGEYRDCGIMGRAFATQRTQSRYRARSVSVSATDPLVPLAFGRVVRLREPVWSPWTGRYSWDTAATTATSQPSGDGRRSIASLIRGAWTGREPPGAAARAEAFHAEGTEARRARRTARRCVSVFSVPPCDPADPGTAWFEWTRPHTPRMRPRVSWRARGGRRCVAPPASPPTRRPRARPT